MSETQGRRKGLYSGGRASASWPVFGATTAIMERLGELGCVVVDTTCGDVMSVWKRVRQYAKQGVTSIIHGKAMHEETKATSSRRSSAIA